MKFLTKVLIKLLIPILVNQLPIAKQIKFNQQWKSGKEAIIDEIKLVIQKYITKKMEK